MRYNVRHRATSVQKGEEARQNTAAQDGAATGYMPGVKKAGVTAGRGSCLQTSKQMRTKCMNNLKNGADTIIKDKSAFTPTAFKMFKGEYYDKAVLPGSIAGSTLSWTTSTMREWK